MIKVQTVNILKQKFNLDKLELKDNHGERIKRMQNSQVEQFQEALI